jgi:hypothetical protein
MRKILVALACTAMVVTSAYATSDVAPTVGEPSTGRTFTYLGQFPVVGNDYAVGVGFDGMYLWVTAGNQATGYCEFYVYDEYGNLIDTAHQGGGATGWGLRDLCFDGQYMFGSYSMQINGFSDILVYDGYFLGPINPNRAMAFDGMYYYTAGFGTNLYQLDWDGVWGSSAFPTVLGSTLWAGAYGLAYDCVNDCLWMSTADYSGDVYRIGLDGTLLETLSTLSSGFDIAGGCTMAQTAQWGDVLVILQQYSPDTITFWDVDGGFSPVEAASWGAIKNLFE